MNKKRRILHFTSGEDKHGGKASILSILGELKNQEDIMLAVMSDGDLTQAAREARIPVIHFKQSSRYDFRIIFKVINYLKKENYDLLHCHGPRANLFGSLIKPFTKVPVITTIHSDYILDDYKGSAFKTKIFRKINSLAIKSLDAYVCISHTFKRTLIERGLPVDRIFVTYNSVAFKKTNPSRDLTIFRKHNVPYQEGYKYIGIIGRLEPVKNHGMFLLGAKEMLKRQDKLHFIIAGDGSMMESLKNQAQDLGIENQVSFLGHIDGSDDFFEMIDINVLTSFSEGAPYAILEGAVYKKPTVATNIGGVRNMITHNVNGLLVEVDDVISLAETVLNLTHDDALCEKLGNRLYDHIKSNFSIQKMVKDYQAAYNAMLINRKKYFIIGYYGRFNHGDECILYATVKMLRSIDPTCEIKVLSYHKAKTRNLMGIEGVSRNSLISIISTLVSSDTVILGGGTLLQTASSKRSLWYYLFMTYIAKVILDKKVMMLGNGIGPIDGKLSREKTAYLLKKLDLILLRDEGSRKYLQTLASDIDNIDVTTDFVYYFEKELKNASTRSLDKKTIGFNLRQWDIEDDFYQDVAQTINALVDDGYRIEFVAFEKSDYFAIKKVLNHCSQKHSVFYDDDFMKLFDKIRSYNGFISMRLHGLIFSTIVKTPFIALSYDPKVNYYCERLDYDYCLDINQYSKNACLKILHEVFDKKSDIIKQFTDYEEKQCELIQRSIKIMSHSIKDQQ